MEARAFERSHLDELLAAGTSPRLSITMPTHRYGKEALQGGPTLQRLLDEAQRRLMAAGASGEESERLLRPARDLARDPEFWTRQEEGLLLLVADGEARCYRLPYHVEEQVAVADRFVLRPLLPLLAREERYYVIAVSAKEVRVVEASPAGARRVAVPGLPANMTEALGYDQYYSEIDRHVGGAASLGRRRAIVHGHGDQDEERARTNLAAYFRSIAQALQKSLPARAPWVLAAIESHFPIFREAAADERLVSGGIAGNPELWSDEELCERASALVAEVSDRHRDEALRRLERQAGTPKVATELSTLLAAAHQGRVELLFVDPDARHWGTFEPRSGELEIHADRRAGDLELVDAALYHTLRAGGEVWEVERGLLPVPAEAAALLRY